MTEHDGDSTAVPGTGPAPASVTTEAGTKQSDFRTVTTTAHPEPLQPGWKSSEFLLVTIGTIAGIIVAAGVFPDTHWSARLAGALATGLLPWRYGGQRAALKAQK